MQIDIVLHPVETGAHRPRRGRRATGRQRHRTRTGQRALDAQAQGGDLDVLAGMGMPIQAVVLGMEGGGDGREVPRRA